MKDCRVDVLLSGAGEEEDDIGMGESVRVEVRVVVLDAASAVLLEVTRLEEEEEVLGSGLDREGLVLAMDLTDKVHAVEHTHMRMEVDVWSLNLSS